MFHKKSMQFAVAVTTLHGNTQCFDLAKLPVYITLLNIAVVPHPQNISYASVLDWKVHILNDLTVSLVGVCCKNAIDENLWHHIDSKYTTGKKYGIFSISAIFAYLRSVQGVSVLEIHYYEYILLLGELITT